MAHERDARDTREQLLEAAEELMQSHGYNAVSYRDLAERVGVRTASIHYHFPAKGDLGKALISRYRRRFDEARVALDRSGEDALGKLTRYVGAIEDAFRQTGRMCLCGVFAAETSTLPEEVAAEVRDFFRENEAWLARVLAEGRKGGSLRFEEKPEEAARSLFGALEGALMSAWTFSDRKRFSAAGRWLIRSLSSKEGS